MTKIICRFALLVAFVLVPLASGIAQTPAQDQALINSLKDWVGAASPAGTQGPQGLQGIQGPQGVQGPIGPQGAVGPQGPAGSGGGATIPSWTFLAPVGGDNAVPINAALVTGNVMLGCGTFPTSTTILVPGYRMLVGSGECTTILKAFNGDVLDLGNQSHLRDFRFEQQDPAWVGGGIIVKAGANFQYITKVNGWAKDFWLKFVDIGAGGRIKVLDASVGTYDVNAFAIQLPIVADPNNPGRIITENPGTGLRAFDTVVANGGKGFDLGGAADTFIIRSNFTDFKFRPETLGADIIYNRFATGAGISVPAGYHPSTNYRIVGNRFQHPLTLMPGLLATFVAFNMGASIVNNSGQASVKVYQ